MCVSGVMFKLIVTLRDQRVDVNRTVHAVLVFVPNSVREVEYITWTIEDSVWGFEIVHGSC